MRMRKTIAKVESLDYVPYGCLGIEFCDVHFYGFRKEEMKRKWRHIENIQYNKYNSLYKKNEIKIQNLNTKADSIYKQVKENRPFYRFWYTKAEKEMLAKAQKLSYRAYLLEEENQEINDKMFLDYDVYECHRKIEFLLHQNGFILARSYSRDDEYTNIEVWVLKEFV